MDRRDFLKGAAAVAIAAGVAGKLKAADSIVAGGEKADLIAVKGGTPGDMFDLGIAELGGVKAFVKPGQTVVIKPNIGWNKEPEVGANTNPELIGRMVKRCLEAGAREVAVFDNTCQQWTGCYSASGIKAAVEAEGGKMVSGALESDYREIQLPKAKRLKSVKVHSLILDSDVFFNVPVLKHHGGAKMTCAMKNFMGLVWDRRFFHGNDLQQCIADSMLIRKPDLNVVDAYRVMCSGGPQGNANSKMRDMTSLLLSRDIVAIDTAAAAMIEFPLNTIGHIGLGEEMGFGTTDLKKLNIKKITV